MTVRYSYTDASRRLLADATALWADGRRVTASHLAGLSAECSLKSILVGLGAVTVGPDGQMSPPGVAPGNQRLRVHIDKLWGAFQMHLQGHSGAFYAARLPRGVPAPYDGWSVDHRYVAEGQLGDDDLERWVWAAVVLHGLLREADARGEAQ